MRVGFTDELKANILQQFFTLGDELYVGLFLTTGQPEEEPVELVIGEGEGDYTREQVVFGTPNGGLIYNTQPITWNTASYDWTSGGKLITHIGIFNNDGTNVDTSGSNENPYEGLLVYLPLSQGESVLEGNTFVLNTDAIRLQLV